MSEESEVDFDHLKIDLFGSDQLDIYLLQTGNLCAYVPTDRDNLLDLRLRFAKLLIKGRIVNTSGINNIVKCFAKHSLTTLQ